VIALIEAGTVTDAGTESTVALVDASATVLPPAGAARLKVTVHVVEAPGARLTGTHASDETVGLGVTVIVAVAFAPSDAVSVTVCDVLTAPAVAVNVAEVADAATATDAGVVSAVLLSVVSATLLPPVGAGCVRVTVHVVEAPDTTLAGLHESVDTEGLGVTAIVVVVLPRSVAVSVTTWGAWIEPVVTENVVELVVAGTVTDPGTGTAVALSDASATMLPPAGAGWVSVTVQVLVAPAITLAGAQASDDTLALGMTLTVAVVLAPSVAVTVTVWGVATEDAVAVNVPADDVAGTATEAGTGSAALLSDASVTVLPPVGAG